MYAYRYFFSYTGKSFNTVDINVETNHNFCLPSTKLINSISPICKTENLIYMAVKGIFT
jgi:hypothetical protein